MLSKFRDWNDTKVPFVILVDSIEDMMVLTNVITDIGRKRLSYKIYKDEITAYMVEIQMPYNRYLAMMKLLIKKGYNLRSESKVNIFQRLIKTES